MLLLWAGRTAKARDVLGRSLREESPSPVAYLALGDALWEEGWWPEAREAYREAFGLSPELSWTPAWPQVPRLREESIFRGPWWPVGAYLEGGLPRYARASPETLAAAVRRFHRYAGARPPPSAPVLFFLGLRPSEHGPQLQAGDLAPLRRTLRDLHPEAFELHLERLRELGPPAPRAPSRFPVP